jgi:hypothetical protein
MGVVAEAVAAAVVVRMGIAWGVRINERRDGNRKIWHYRLMKLQLVRSNDLLGSIFLLQ